MFRHDSSQRSHALVQAFISESVSTNALQSAARRLQASAQARHESAIIVLERESSLADSTQNSAQSANVCTSFMCG
jgi:hypothetical protein